MDNYQPHEELECYIRAAEHCMDEIVDVVRDEVSQWIERVIVEN